MWFLLIILLLISIWYLRLFHRSRREDEPPRARQMTVDRYNPEQIPATPEPRLRRALCGGVSSRDICEVCRTVDIGLLFCDEPRVVFEPEEELDGVFAEWDIDTIRTETRRARCCRLCYLLQYILDHGFDTARGIIKISRFIRGGHSIQRIEVVVNDEEGAKTACRHLSDIAIVSVDSYPAALLYKTWEKLQREIDFDLASFWIDACHKEHGATCQPPRELMLSLRRSSKLLSRLSDKLVTRAGGLYINKDLNKDGLNPPLRLIDVQKMCIVMAETPPAFWFRHDKREPVPMYVTLSYVWGSIEENRESPKLVKGKVISWSKRGALKREPLPKTVMDAIQCTKRLGVGYLWVDRLCIVQDDLPERDATVKVMDSIYMRAYCTVIAVSAKNCYGGIRGVGGASLPWKLEQDRPPRKVTIRGISLISVRKNPLAELWESAWKTRGWTFQEKFLSPRSLLMMDSSAVFWCSKTMQCQDSLGWFKVPEQLDMYDSTMLRSTLSSMGPLSTSSAGKLGVQLLSLEEAAAESRDTAATLRRARRQYCDFLEGALTGYLGRQLSLETDYLKAFSGVLGYMRDVLGLGSDCHGIPSHILGDAIAWQSHSSLRPGGLLYPTWSWVAWKFDPSEISFSIQIGDSLLWIYREDLDDRCKLLTFGTPLKPRDYGPGCCFSHFVNDKDEIASAFERRANRQETPIGPNGTLPGYQLGSSKLAFFTSAADLVISPSSKFVDDKRIWIVYSPLMDIKLTSILLTVEQERWCKSYDEFQRLGCHWPREAREQFVVIQAYSGERSVYSSWFRLMMVRWLDEIAYRIAVTEDAIPRDAWEGLSSGLGGKDVAVKRKLVILG